MLALRVARYVVDGQSVETRNPLPVTRTRIKIRETFMMIKFHVVLRNKDYKDPPYCISAAPRHRGERR